MTPRGARLVRFGWVVLCALLGGCLRPEILEVRLVSDTDGTAGGHQVQALVRDTTGLTEMELLFSGTVPGAAESDAAERDMERTEVLDGSAERWRGQVGAYPVGTTVRYAVRACNRLGQCTTEPQGWPATEALAFVVGRLPSRPLVTQVTPGVGPTVGGVRVSVSGEDFRPGMRLTVDGAPCAFTEVLTTTDAACVLPPGDVGPADVTAENPDGGSGTLRDGFVYYATPIPLRVDPPLGPTAGGTPVRVEGRDFVPGVRVTFEGRQARSVVVLSDGLLTCVTPPGNPGFADVAVEHPLGGAGVLPDGYRYVPPPRVDGVLPPEGPDFGGQEVTVVGDNFLDGATVRVGDAECLNVVVLSPTQLTCTVQGGPAGAADVTVTNPDGQSGQLPGGYYYNGPPLVLGVDPPEGPLVAGAEATVLGAGFLMGVTVRVDGVVAEVVNQPGRDRVIIRVPAATEPTQPPPATGTRAVDIRVENPLPDGRSATGVGLYTYVWPPEVTSTEPDRGPTRGGTAVRVLGRFFRPILAEPLLVSFDGVPCTNLAVVSSTELTCETPAGNPGPADVAVRNFETPLQQGVGLGVYLYVPPPRVDSVVPGEGPTFGGETVTINGAFFQPGASVTLDGAPCVNVMVAADGNSLTCVTPPGERGRADVRVVNPDLQEDTLEQGYLYVAVAVTPNGGFEAGFTRVRLRAAGLQDGVEVFFGSVRAPLVTRVSSRELVVQSPAQGVGVVDVRFRNPDGTSDVAQMAFEYRTFQDRTEGSGLGNDFTVGNDAEQGDLDGDGISDVVVANGDVGGAEDSVVYLTRRVNGGVRFEVRTLPDAFLTANQASLGDVDQDGDLDLLLAASQQTQFYLNDGTGRFSLFGLPSQGDGAFDGVLADLTGDGLLDIYMLNIGCSNVMDMNCEPLAVGRDVLLVNNGGLNFSDQSFLVPHDAALVHDHKVELLDVDGSGKPDLIINVDNKNFEGLAGRPRHRVLLNVYPAAFQEISPPDFSGIVGDVYGIAVGDLDGDGRGDIVQPSFVPSSLGQLGDPGTPGSTIVLLGESGGGFRRDDARGIPLLDEPSINVHVRDMDGDGDLEFFTINLGGVMRLWINTGDGTFVDGNLAIPQVVLEAADVAPADYDGDGDLDLVVINHGPDLLWLAEPQR